MANIVLHNEDYSLIAAPLATAALVRAGFAKCCPILRNDFFINEFLYVL
jgi:hypothetical protein